MQIMGGRRMSKMASGFITGGGLTTMRSLEERLHPGEESRSSAIGPELSAPRKKNSPVAVPEAQQEQAPEVAASAPVWRRSRRSRRSVKAK